ncbi:MAG: homoserine kinase [Rickettsiales bacterium]
MAVYTKLNNHDLNAILANYNLTKLISASEINAGVENTNYLLTTKTAKYVLTIFEKRVNCQDLPFFINLMNFLATNSFPAPQILTQNNSYIFNHNHKNGIIITFLPGNIADKITLNKEILFNLGQKLAELHILTTKFPEKRASDFTPNKVIKLFTSIKEKNLLDPQEITLIANIIDNFSAIDLTKLSQTIIHADLFPDNVFLNNNTICGVIDFYFSCYDHLNYDLATTINAWCFDQNINLNQDLLINFLQGYNLTHKLKLIDKKYLLDFCLFTAVRFFLTRLYDKFHQPKDANITAKIPEEFLKRIYFWHNFKDFDKILNNI